MQSQASQPAVRNELSARDLARILWRDRWLIVVVTAVFTGGATLASLLIPKTYKAATVLAAVSRTGAGDGAFGGLGALASQFGGIAALAGISLDGDSKKAESLAVLQSEALTQKYIAESNLLPILYARLWDAEGRRWRVSDPQDVPSLWRASRYFKRKLSNISTDPKSGLITVEIAWRDPKLAAQWANDLVKLTNHYLRDKAIAESERNIAYLQEEALKTDIVGAREAIYAVLQNEINKAMLARGSEEYALKVLDPAVAPEKAASPQPLLWIPVGFFGGLLLSLFAVVFRAAWLA
jgi:uncharacterized protein involved in exopolysaccharide biosynthesis